VKKVSVITINRNNAEGLEKTIESVISQTFGDFEFIIIDGNSSDNSIEIINKYSVNITYWVSEPDSGIYNAMNKGLAKASGEYLIFMNSGDSFVSVNTLSDVFNEKRNKDILAGRAIITEMGRQKRCDLPREITLYELATYPFAHQAIFIRRAIFIELGVYDESLKIAADWKSYYLAIFKYGKQIELMDIDIAVIEPNGISTGKEADEIISKERKEVLQEYFPYFYEDYIFLRKIRRFTWRNIRIGIKVRLNRLFYKK